MGPTSFVTFYYLQAGHTDGSESAQRYGHQEVKIIGVTQESVYHRWFLELTLWSTVKVKLDCGFHISIWLWSLIKGSSQTNKGEVWQKQKRCFHS